MCYPRTLGRAALLSVLLSGCVSGSDQPQHSVTPELAGAVEFPTSWERVPEAVTGVTPGQCLSVEPVTQELLTRAQNSNLTLKSLRSQVEEARLGVVVVRADRLPTLSAALNTTRRRVNANQFQAPRQTYTLGLDSQLELDIWGRLSDSQRQAQFLYRAAQFEYAQAVRTVFSDVARAHYALQFALDLADVLERRVTSVQNNLEIVEQSYRQGINTALDVYLARTSLSQERTRLAQQRQTVFERMTALQLLLNEYPAGGELTRLLTAESAVRYSHSSLQEVPAPFAVVENRPDVQQAWVQLLAQDAAVAVAHKERFPRLVFSANVDDLEQDIAEIIDGENVVWSLVANVTQPIFQAGRLKALERQALEQLERAELNYIGLLQQAYAEVDDALSASRSLTEQLQAANAASQAAEAAYELSFQQYRRGLVTYTTVLQSEQRAFDATTTRLELEFQRRQNRIDLCAALGEFPRAMAAEQGATT